VTALITGSSEDNMYKMIVILYSRLWFREPSVESATAERATLKREGMLDLLLDGRGRVKLISGLARAR